MKEAMRQLCKEDEGEKKDGGLKEEVEDEEKECEEEAEEEGGDPRMRRDGDEGNRGDATKDFEKNPSLDPAITGRPCKDTELSSRKSRVPPTPSRWECGKSVTGTRKKERESKCGNGPDKKAKVGLGLAGKQRWDSDDPRCTGSAGKEVNIGAWLGCAGNANVLRSCVRHRKESILICLALGLLGEMTLGRLCFCYDRLSMLSGDVSIILEHIRWAVVRTRICSRRGTHACKLIARFRSVYLPVGTRDGHA
ncbi:hypothetical protein CRG98_013555 [Punica granatum]|uniref:Uncharacterized protein n=1 Tax=Punica granatum TaxID=22663 RepID=A0A2I0KCX3_PUNGR|nr:hypothetical protein CRG98_013555 [Punica granatum]